MKVTLNLPDGTSVVNVAIVYQKYGQLYCASRLLDSDIVKDGAVFDLVQPQGKTKEEDDE